VPFFVTAAPFKGVKMKKAYGFPLFKAINHVTGVCVDEGGKTLGHWTSSSLSWLKYDLQNHAQDHDYEFYERLPAHIAEKIGHWAREAEESGNE
jgi:hypothetical protein